MTSWAMPESNSNFKCILVPTRFYVKKSFGFKKVRVQKILGPKSLGFKKIRAPSNIGSKIF